MNPLSMFKEKDGQNDVLSMTRVVAFLFAVTYCYSLVLYAKKGAEFGWPFCVLGVVVTLAVPLQAMFKYLQLWLATSPGQAVLRDLLSKLSGTVLSSVPTTSVKTEVSTGGPSV